MITKHYSFQHYFRKGQNYLEPKQSWVVVSTFIFVSMLIIFGFVEVANAASRVKQVENNVDMNCQTKWEGSHRNPGAMFQAMRNNPRRDGYATSANGASPKDVADQYPENNAANVGEFIRDYAKCRP